MRLCWFFLHIGYINEGGVLNLKRLEVFLAALGEIDKSLFGNQNANLDCLKGDKVNEIENYDFY